MKQRILLLLGITTILSSTGMLSNTASAQLIDTTEAKRESLAITVYNNNLGVIRDVRRFSIKSGTNEVRMRDVPAQIDPTTVKITDHEHANVINVTEQNYEYDLVSQAKLLEKYIDHTVTLIDEKGMKIEGTLLSASSDDITLATPNGITMIPSLAKYQVQVAQLPAGLITRPTLIWRLESDRALPNEPLEVLYQTAGMSWHAEYIAALSDDDRSLDLTGWVSIENNSGASFPNAKLKLVAGDVHRYTPRPPAALDYEAGVSSFGKAVAPQFAERGMFEYHLYDLQRKTSINNAEVKQVSLLEASGVKAEKKYTYLGGKNVEVTVAFQNSEENHLGIPIPMGTVRVMKRDKDGTLEFVGEDHVEHTPRDEKLTLKVGDAFDLLGEHVTTDEHNLGSHANSASYEITLKNRKDENVTIDVVEEVGTDWEITKNSMDFEKKNASQIVFHVPVKARSEQKVTYTIVHRW
jgi:hypothetical protein